MPGETSAPGPDRKMPQRPRLLLRRCMQGSGHGSLAVTICNEILSMLGRSGDMDVDVLFKWARCLAQLDFSGEGSDRTLWKDVSRLVDKCLQVCALCQCASKNFDFFLEFFDFKAFFWGCFFEIFV